MNSPEELRKEFKKKFKITLTPKSDDDFQKKEVMEMLFDNYLDTFADYWLDKFAAYKSSLVKHIAYLPTKKFNNEEYLHRSRLLSFIQEGIE